MATKSAYGASAREIAELFAEHLEGNADRPALALSSDALDEVSRNAIEKSLVAFGYEPESCTYACCGTLDSHALYLLIEGLDPLHVIATDRNATALLSQAYRIDFPLDSPIRIAGRSSVSFADLSSLMETADLKQRAWRLLKTLPKI